jgi:hypothetical protein
MFGPLNLSSSIHGGRGFPVGEKHERSEYQSTGPRAAGAPESLHAPSIDDVVGAERGLRLIPHT